MDPFSHFVTSELVSRFVKLVPYWRLVKYKAWHRSRRIRISFSALLIVQQDSTYAIIRSLHRPDSFGPIGGVFKYYKHYRDLSRNYEFEPQYSKNIHKKEMDCDLRGFVPAKNIYAIVRWFEKGGNRETAAECLFREMKEEFSENSIPIVLPVLNSGHFLKVRTIYEGPHPVPGTDFFQYRILEIYEFVQDPLTDSLVLKMAAVNSSSAGLVFATTEEINLGRLRRVEPRLAGRPIGRNAEYLLRARAERPDTAPI